LTVIVPAAASASSARVTAAFLWPRCASRSVMFCTLNGLFSRAKMSSTSASAIFSLLARVRVVLGGLLWRARRG
jgi:hypothetical protein